MSYVVLARKWRPRTFEDLTGQGHVARTLTNAIERDRVPHALLFTGSRGVGKTSSARILAMALNCRAFDAPTTKPCGECDSCREIQAGQAVDVLEIDGASNRGINEIRELRDGVRYAANRDRYKVYIIDEVHMLTTEAFNALLKTLEEPPKHVIFIFATTEAHKIPVTILSRVQRFDFRRIPYAEMLGRLAQIVDAEGLKIDREVLGMIARQASGGMRDSLSLLDQVIAFGGDTIDADAAAEILGAAERRKLFELTGAIISQDIDSALGVIDEVTSFGVSLSHFANEFVAHVRDLTVVAVSRNPERLTSLTDSEIALARTQSKKTDPRTLQRVFQLAVEAAESIARSAHAQLVFEMALVRMVALEPVHTVRALIDRLEALSRGEPLPEPPHGGTPPPSSSGTAGDGSTSSHATALGSSEGEDAHALSLGADAQTPTPKIVEASESSESASDALAAQAPAHAQVRATAEDASELGNTHGDKGQDSVAAATGNSGPRREEGEAAIGQANEPTGGGDESGRAEAGHEDAANPELATTSPDSGAAPSETAPPEEARPEETLAGSSAGPDDATNTEQEVASLSPDFPAPPLEESTTTQPPELSSQERERTEPTEAHTPNSTEEPPDADSLGDDGVVLSNDQWREVVVAMRERDSRLSALFSDGYVIRREGGSMLVGIDDFFVDRASTADISTLEQLIFSVTGARIRVRTCPTSEVDPATLDSAYHVQQEEAQERAAYESRIIDYVKNHPSTRFIMNAWPKSRMKIRVSEMTPENAP